MSKVVLETQPCKKDLKRINFCEKANINTPLIDYRAASKLSRPDLKSACVSSSAFTFKYELI